MQQTDRRRYFPADLPAASTNRLINLRGEALLHNARTFLLLTFPWGLFALIPSLGTRSSSLESENRASLVKTFGVYALTLFAVSALLFPIPTMAGTFYHSLGAAVPGLSLLAVATIDALLRRLAQRRGVQRSYIELALAAIVALALVQLDFVRPAVADRHASELKQFHDVAAWLEANVDPQAVIMTTQPYTLNWVSNRPAVVLPPNDPPTASLAAARQYDVQVLVITQLWGAYPDALNAAENETEWKLAADLGASKIYTLDRP